MKCPICLYEDTKVIDSRVASDGLSIRRRRECLECGFRFSTSEEMEILDLIVLKRDDKKEYYSKDKLVSGLKLALEKRPVSDDELKKLVNAIERELQQLKMNEVESGVIGKIVMKHLKELDLVAYIRFASVCQEFENLEDFRDELNKLLSKNKDKK